MKEVIVLFDHDGKAFHWHDQDAQTGHVPDSDDIWDVIWDNRERFAGFAHTHPWHGPAIPSSMDLSTYQAIELGLGRHCFWPVVTFNNLTCVVRNPLYQPENPNGPAQWTSSMPADRLRVCNDWVDELRRRSGFKS